ncbi:MAG: S9 family peptidase [Flavobacteriales bacterium]|nr:MAG: S9 family peptidase [Flavobacteriales bacterium]
MKYFSYLITFLFLLPLSAQENLSYQKPSKEILELVDVELAPSVMMNNNKDILIFRYSKAFSSIAELSEPELRLGGLRINPVTNIGNRTRYYNNIRVKKLSGKNKDIQQVTGLPKAPRLAYFSWSPKQDKLAFTHTGKKGVSLWVLDMETLAARQITPPVLNANLGDVINWFEEGNSLLVKMLPKDKKKLINTADAVPEGPTVSVNYGEKAQNRTYQDLLKNPNDEFNFEQLCRSTLYKVNLDGTKTEWLPTNMYDNISFSPDGSYLLVTTLKKPFSYIVTYRRFPTSYNIYDKSGKHITTITERPLLEVLPKGFMATQTGKRNISWRNDKPASLIYAEALDGGNPENKVEFRDNVFQLDAPFNGVPKSILKTINRYYSIKWGTDNLAVANDYWWNTRNTKSYVFNPSDTAQKPEILFDRNYQDVYADPGYFVMKRNDYGNYVLELDKNNNAFLIGDGFSKKGQFPFVDKINLKTKQKSTIYKSKYIDKLEKINDYDPDKNRILAKIESPTEYPNYYFRNLRNNKLTQLTDFKNPFTALQNVHKEIIQYKRDDGLDLSGTLYLPVGYDKAKKEKMPMILWAYPIEYKDKSSASQTTSNPNSFIAPHYGSPIYWVNKGYVVLDRAAFPIIGEGDTEPNDSFRKQLVANAKAAIDAVNAMGYIDWERVAVGGHSYGAFMVANLLSHSDLFAAGIARSGAYNRTLTPFGFQSEERNYWEAPEVYYTMSPFMHAEKMKTPLLLIHGAADNNSGTYPMQSERYFNALKGLGATVRLVMLPKESHGYRAKESILHMLWEQDQWLEKYVKNKK